MLDALKAIVAAVKELNLGVGGFFALVFLAVFVWGAKRTAAFAGGLSGEWKRLIDEGIRVRDQLKEELREAHQIIGEKDALIEELRQGHIDLTRRYLLLEAKVKVMQESKL